RTTGAPFVTWFSVKRSEFRIVAGEPARVPSRQARPRSLFRTGGNQPTLLSDDYPDGIDVTTCNLDDPEALPPHDHTRTSSKLRWLRLADGLPEFLEARPD